MCRRSSGATLALVLALIFILILLGSFGYYYFQILGGGRQSISASDAGSLNVAKVALLAPTVQLKPANQIDKTIQEIVLNGSTNVNLLNFNKIVVWGLLTAINANADGNATAQTEAKAIWMRIEGDPVNSIGAQLKAALTSSNTNITSTSSDVPSGPWPSTVFEFAAQRNAIGLADSDKNQDITWQSFEAGYLGAGDSTNVQGALINNNLPYINPVTGQRYKLTLPLTSDGYVQGYVPIKVGSLTYYFVTVYHDQTPGLRTRTEFSENMSQPGQGTVALPPNTFYNHANMTLKKTKSTLVVGSPATVGTNAYPPVSYSSGYLVLDNTPTGTYTGIAPGACNDVTCDELGQGILEVTQNGNGQFFTTSPDSATAIINYIDNGGLPPSSLDGIYNNDGSQATVKDLNRVKALGPVDPSPPTICTDTNSDAADGDGVPACENMYNIWNSVYHPNKAKNSNMTVNGLTGAEIYKDFLPGQFFGYNGTGKTITLTASKSYVGSSLDTGLALYYADANPITSTTANIPWGTKGVYNNGYYGANSDQFGQSYCCPGADFVDTKRIGKVTQLFTLPAIFDQTTISPPSFTTYSVDTTGSSGSTTTTYTKAPSITPSQSAYNFFQQRCLQMGATQTDITTVWNKTQLDLGDIYYVYLNSNKKLVASTTPPANISALKSQLPPTNTGLDGMNYRFYKSYNVLWNIVNAEFDFNIHDRLFMGICSPGVLQATDSCYIENGTGALAGSLGRLSFHQTIGNGPGNPPIVYMETPLTVGVTTDSTLEGVSSSKMTGAPQICDPN